MKDSKKLLWAEGEPINTSGSVMDMMEYLIQSWTSEKTVLDMATPKE